MRKARPLSATIFDKVLAGLVQTNYADVKRQRRFLTDWIAEAIIGATEKHVGCNAIGRTTELTEL